MAVLTPAKRADMPKKEFAGPGKSFPIPDATHAKLALAFVGRSEAAGHISPEEANHIRVAAHAKLADHHKKLGEALKRK